MKLAELQRRVRCLEASTPVPVVVLRHPEGKQSVCEAVHLPDDRSLHGVEAERWWAKHQNSSLTVYVFEFWA